MATEKTALQSSTMHDEDEPIQPLLSCVRSIKQLWNDRSDESLSKYAEFNSSCLAFMYHLKLDQERLFQAAGSTSRDAEGSQSEEQLTPHQNEIPAIAALMNDGVLFRTFLSMLTTKPYEDTDVGTTPLIPGNGVAPSSTGQPTQSNQHVKKSKITLNKQGLPNSRKRMLVPKIPEGAEAIMSTSVSNHSLVPSEVQQNYSTQQQTKKSKVQSLNKQLTSNIRKRTLSYEFESTPQKAPKHMYSPKPNLTSDIRKTTPLPNLPPPPLLPNFTTETKPLASNFTPVLAATIFFSAFRHLDHWPPIFLKAFAADSFGPRRWVDNEKCALFVQNLLTALKPEPMNTLLVCKDHTDIVDTFAAGYERMEVSRNLLESSIRLQQDRLESKLSFNSESDERSLKNNQLSDSDSGEEECVMEVSSGKLLNQTKKNPSSPNNSNAISKHDSSDSSSGDEEELEEVIVSNAGISKSSIKKPIQKINGLRTKKSNSETSMITNSSGKTQSSFENSNQSTESTCWWYQRSLDITPIRSRFVGSIRKHGYEFVADALSARLEAKVKQNSSLLSTLPSFLKIPRVRSLTAGYLERWLQSPALSGLARGLFSSIVGEMKNIEPPLVEDILAIDSILSMKLKANQSTIHIENITAIVRTIPTKSISQHIFLHLLREEFSLLESNDNQSTTMVSNPMNIFMHVHSSLPSDVAANALAAATLSLISTKDKSAGGKQSTKKNNSDINTVLLLIRKVSSILGSKYNGYLLVNSILREHSEGLNRAIDESNMYGNIEPDDIAQLVYECATLVVPVPSQISVGNSRQQLKFLKKNNENQYCSMSEEEIAKISSTLLSIRKCILKWCLDIYLSFKIINKKYDVRKQGGKEKSEKKISKYENSHQEHRVLVGAGEPKYDSVLDGESDRSSYSTGSKDQDDFIQLVQCLLFLSRPETKSLMAFLNGNIEVKDISQEHMSHEQRYRINFCCDYGADIDDELMQIILHASSCANAHNTPELYISIIEQLFYHCRNEEKAQLKINDCNIVWDMYKLAVYTPSISTRRISKNHGDKESVEENNSKANPFGEKRKRENESDEDTPDEIPRLAFPGFWWRITGLVLIMSGLAPKSIGVCLWKEHPTVRSIMKMITSGRYRFPTVDCDETEREKTKKKENDLRSKEAAITKALFLPKSQRIKKARKDYSPPHTQIGSRSSARQKAKQERLIAIQQEQEAARALAEEQRIKKLLRSAQKTIMIWDPHCHARKPPKESVTLILSVSRLFNLSELFRLCIEPDIVLQTIGSTSRDSIERAYDWLIPVVSTHPQVIDRLPPSASCFLLLRAYGTDKSQNSQLLELSSPLLSHVTNCLIGKYGEDGAIRAVDLLFVDLADPSPDRRRCARRVLQEATVKIEPEPSVTTSLHIDEFGWLFNIMKVKYAPALISTVISNISHALAYERGRVLCAYVLALKQYIDFALDNSVEVSWNFTNILCELLSIRPHVCCAAMDRHVDLRNLAIDVVHNSFKVYIDDEKIRALKSDSSVEMKICCIKKKSGDEKETIVQDPISVFIPLQLLRAALVLISNWSDDEEENFISHNTNARNGAQMRFNESRETLLSLVNYLIPLDDSFPHNSECFTLGAASAIFTRNGRRAVTVEQWVMLAKSRCEFIAKNAAYCTPEIFLPRLLLCCGLPTSSFMSMLERLGKLGDASSDRDKCFNQLLSPSVTSEWGMGHSSKRGLIAWKLLGRISAYLSIFGEKSTNNQVKDLSSSFLVWLTGECRNNYKSKKQRPKKNGLSSSNTKGKALTPDHLSSQKTVISSLSNIVENIVSVDRQDEKDTDSIERNSLVTRRFYNQHEDLILSETSKEDSVTCELLDELACSGSFDLMESLLSRQASSLFSFDPHILESRGIFRMMTKVLLRSFNTYCGNQQLFSAIILKWIPIFSQYHADPSFYSDLFKSDFSQKDRKNVIDVLILRCVRYWTSETIQACQSWILTQMANFDNIREYNLHLAVKFILLSSGQIPSQKKIFLKPNKSSFFSAIRSQENAKACVNLLLECAKNDSMILYEERNEYEGTSSYTSRNNLPDWLELLLIIGKCGKKYLTLMTKAVVEEASKSDFPNNNIFLGVLLRIYVHFPSTMDLSDAKTRAILIRSVKIFSKEWVHWRTALDKQIVLSIDCLAMNPNQRQHQILSDLSKRYPLLVVRDIHVFLKSLRKDATCCNEDKSRGRIMIDNDELLANTSFGIVKVKVTHWGYSFTEQLWISVLEIMDSLPKEVLFACGIDMGLFNLYNLFIELIGVQIDIGSKHNISRLKSKLAQSLSFFKTSNQSNFDDWMKMCIQGFEKRGTISSLLSTYGIVIGETF